MRRGRRGGRAPDCSNLGPLTDSGTKVEHGAMYRLHPDDLAHVMIHDHAAYLRRWLEKHGALIVMPDDVQVPDNNMPGCGTSRRGRFGETEPMPLLEPRRQALEDARTGKTKPPQPK